LEFSELKKKRAVTSGIEKREKRGSRRKKKKKRKQREVPRSRTGSGVIFFCYTQIRGEKRGRNPKTQLMMWRRIVVKGRKKREKGGDEREGFLYSSHKFF